MEKSETLQDFNKHQFLKSFDVITFYSQMSANKCLIMVRQCNELIIKAYRKKTPILLLK